MMDKLQVVVERTAGFNTVSAFRTPNGELVITLTHRNTDDESVTVRVRGEDDVIIDSDVDWEDDTTRAGRINHGGNWDG